MQKFSFFLLLVSMCGAFVYSVGFPVAIAQVMQSTNYQIESDSVNGGGGFSSSSSYVVESTTGEVGTGESGSASYNLYAGYQQMQEVYIAISGASAITMSPAISGISGGISDGETTVTVTTDSMAGYQLTIEAEGSPAMQKGVDSVADYVPSAAPPDYTFNIGASDAYFGYTPEGVDVVSRFLDNGADTCAVGSSESSLRCWDGLNTSTEVIASDSNANHPNGATTTVHFRVGIGGAVGQVPGEYYATTTVTALAL